VYKRQIPDSLSSKGYVRGTVQFFNISAGYGFVVLDDGTSCFTHFKDIKGSDGASVSSQGVFPYLCSREVVAVKYQKNEPGFKTTAVRRTV
jgi:hypothetical protein